MYLILNQNHFFRLKEKSVVFSIDQSGKPRLTTTALPQSRFRLTTDVLGNWTVTGLSTTPIEWEGVRGVSIGNQESRQLIPGQEIRVGEWLFQLREADSSGPIAKNLRFKQFELISEIHKHIVDKKQFDLGDSPDERRMGALVAEINQVLDRLWLHEEIEGFLCSQALLEFLVDRVQGYGRSSKRQVLQAYFSKFERLLLQIESILKLDEEPDFESQTERIESLLPWLLQTHPHLVNPTDRKSLALAILRKHSFDMVLGLGPLDDLMYCPEISEVMVLPSGEIFLERKGQLQRSGRFMLSPEITRQVINRIVWREGRSIDLTKPIVDARLSDGSRGNFVIEPVALTGPCLTIRRFTARKLSIDDLCKLGMMPTTLAEFLRACILARKNILISGGTGSGKTTLLNALAAYIPGGERIVTVEDTSELQLAHEHVVGLQAKHANLEGTGAISINRLVQNALRMRPDRIIVGECRGGEALAMLQAMNTGHDGSMTTIHANSPPEAMHRLEVIASQSEESTLPSRTIREQIASAIQVIVQIQRFQDGTRRVVSLAEVVGIDEEDGTLIIEEIYAFQKNRKRVRVNEYELVFTGYIPGFLDELIEKGDVSLDKIF